MAESDLTWPHSYSRFSYCFLISWIQGAEGELKHAVALVRPVSVAFEVVSGFRFYKKGVYTSNTCGSKPWVSST